MERGREILKRVGRLYQRPSAKQLEGVRQEQAEGREPERGNPPADAEQIMSRLEFRRPHRSKEGVPEARKQVAEAQGKWQERAEEAERARRGIEERKVNEAEDRTGAAAEPRIQEQDESFEQKFAEAQWRLEEVEARVQAVEQLAARAEHVAGLHAGEPGQVRRTKEAEPQDAGQSSPDTEPPKQPARAAEDGDAINL